MEPTSTQTPTTTAIGLRYGLLTGLVSVIISFGLNMAHLEQSPAKWLWLVALIGGITIAQRAFMQANGGYMSFGQGLGTGMMTALVSGVLSGIFSYIYVTFIDQEMVPRILEKVRADMEAKGNVSEAQIDQGMHYTSMFMQGPLLAVVTVIGMLFWGLVISLIIAAILKNPKPEFE